MERERCNYYACARIIYNAGKNVMDGKNYCSHYCCNKAKNEKTLIAVKSAPEYILEIHDI